MEEKRNTKNPDSVKKHSIILNAFYIVVVTIIIGYITLFTIDLFTSHGESKVVPDVKRLNINEAISKLERAGFKWEISDSTYNEDYKPGAVIEQTPSANSHAKSIRTIYLSINAISPRLITLPTLTEISIRQGQAILEGLGFKNITTELVNSQYKDLILSVKVNDRQVEPGTKLLLNSRITLIVGDGNELVNDVDSLENADLSNEIGADESSKSLDFM